MAQTTPHEERNVDLGLEHRLDHAWGRDLDIVIRIAADGRVYFHDIPVDMIPVARSLCPDHIDLLRREHAAQIMLDSARTSSRAAPRAAP